MRSHSPHTKGLEQGEFMARAILTLRLLVCSQRAFHATPVAAKKGDISASELSSILQDKMKAASDDVSIDEVRLPGRHAIRGDGPRLLGLNLLLLCARSARCSTLVTVSPVSNRKEKERHVC